MADRVLRMPESAHAVTPAVSGLQRKCDACGKEDEEQPMQRKRDASGAAAEGKVPTVPGSVRRALNAPGQALGSDVRTFFEARFGRDFSGVRVHSDAAAARSARDVAAQAYTVGTDIVFGAGRFSPATHEGKRLLAHELTHVVQQGGAPPLGSSRAGDSPPPAIPATGGLVVQRAGDPAAIPPGFPCPTDLTAGRPAGTDVLFSVGGFTITAAHTAQLTTFRDAWVLAGGTDDILVHGYASTDGDQGPNWTLSCNRAEAVRTELLRLGIPAVRIEVVAHGESTDFGTSAAPNRHAVVSTRAAGILPLPLVSGLLTARDNFAGRSVTRFGVGEVVDLSFVSLPARPAADFGGLEWHLVSGGGTLTGVTPAGTGTYTAPATASAVRLELRVAAGATAGRVVSSHAIAIVVPNGVRMTEVTGTAPNTSPTGGTIPAGTFGAGFLANVFVGPRDVSFQGVVFGEGTVAGVVTPPGSFLGPSSVHPANTFGPAHGGNATTGTPVSPPPDRIATARPASGSFLGRPTCGASDFLWAIPWEFSVAGGPRTRFGTANHHETSSFFCNATIDKGGAGPFCRRIDGTTC
jgi:outer membrane protein OmpA-like peptidoglycan-associated protein